MFDLSSAVHNFQLIKLTKKKTGENLKNPQKSREKLSLENSSLEFSRAQNLPKAFPNFHRIKG